MTIPSSISPRPPARGAGAAAAGDDGWGNRR
uniref:Uncharacterized protein n=1 Tax=Arundo donax TaxID=35708 RepID=A0A0A8ZL26_ARUDO